MWTVNNAIFKFLWWGQAFLIVFTMKDMKGLKVKKMKLFQWWGQGFLIVVIGG